MKRFVAHKMTRNNILNKVALSDFVQLES